MDASERDTVYEVVGLQGVVCFPFCAQVCGRGKKKPSPKPPESSHIKSVAAFPPPQGGCGIVSKLQTPQETRTCCTLWQLVPTWLKDSNIKGGLRRPPKGKQGNASEQPSPLIRGSRHQQSRLRTTDPAPSKAPFPREGLCNPGLTVPCPLPMPAQSSRLGHLTTLQFKAK